MPPQQSKSAPDFIPANASPDFIPATGTVQGESPNYGPDTTVINPTMAQMGKGVLREGAQLLSGAHGFGRGLIEKIPGVRGSVFDQAMQRHQGELDEMAKPANVGEAMGKTGAEMASYLAPAKLETGVAEMAPEALRPLARIGTSAVSSGGMNAMNNGSFTTGAITGGVMGGMGELSRSVLAPGLVRSAIPGNISRDSANALLEETRGMRPSTVLENTEGRLKQAGTDLNAAVNAAERKPAPRIAGFLPPPVEARELAAIAGREPESSPMAFRAASDRNTPRVFNQTQYHSGGAHPELSGRVEQPQGTMTVTPQMSASGPLPWEGPRMEPNASVSLKPAREAAMGLKRTAAELGVPELDTHADALMNWLHHNPITGEEYGEAVTPRKALAIRRGGNEMFGGNRVWNQTAPSRAQGAFRNAYGGVMGELHANVPGTVEPDRLIHALTPARTGLRSLVQKDPSIVGNVSGRVAARTGALTSAGMAAAAGAHQGGLPGAIIGGATGLVLPEVLSMPAAKMGLARALYSTATPKLGRAVMTPLVQKTVDFLRKSGRGDQAQ